MGHTTYDQMITLCVVAIQNPCLKLSLLCCPGPCVKEKMDWQSDPGERLEGIIGDRIVFGEVGG